MAHRLRAPATWEQNENKCKVAGFEFGLADYGQHRGCGCWPGLTASTGVGWRVGPGPRPAPGGWVLVRWRDLSGEPRNHMRGGTMTKRRHVRLFRNDHNQTLRLPLHSDLPP